MTKLTLLQAEMLHVLLQHTNDFNLVEVHDQGRFII